jgi:hypothetical protein
MEPHALRPQCFQAEADSRLNSWILVKHGLTSQQLEKELSATGWTFFFMAGLIRMTAFGFNRDRALHAVLKRVIEAVKQQRCNCLQVESVNMHSVLGIPYVTLSARPRHLQKGIVFMGQPVGELRRRNVAAA